MTHDIECDTGTDDITVDDKHIEQIWLADCKRQLLCLSGQHDSIGVVHILSKGLEARIASIVAGEDKRLVHDQGAIIRGGNGCGDSADFFERERGGGHQDRVRQGRKGIEI